MTEQQEHVDKKNWSLEDRIRKYWFFALVGHFLGTIVVMCFVCLFYALINGIPMASVWEVHHIRELVLRLPLSILQIGVIYYCAGKKQGTKLLTFCLIVGPLAYLAETIPLLLGDLTDSYIGLSCVGLGIATYIWWYAASIQLLKINRKMLAYSKNQRNWCAMLRDRS